ncbi:porin [Moraxella sp. ZJ142]|uniref:porin n=1 Tax=Moraxella marmotae TaxID=3344520 RepID=UPI0035D52650
MKLSQVSLCVLLSVISVNAFAEAKIYGTFYAKAFGTHTSTTDKATGVTTTGFDRPGFYDDASRAGIRGSEKLNDTYEVQYRLEYRIPFDNEKRSLEQRDTWLAVKHKKYGTIKAGRLLSPEPYLEYSLQSTDADGYRTNNSFRYESPTIKDTQLWVQYFMDENSDKDSVGSDGFAVMLKQEKSKYGIGVAYIRATATKSLHGYKLDDALRLSGYYQATPKVRLSTLYQHNNHVDFPTEKGITATIEHTNDHEVGKNIWVSYTDNHVGYGESGGTQYGIGVGANKNLSKSVNVSADLEYYHSSYPAKVVRETGLYLGASYRF